jgi:hypothetical protein
MATPPAVKINCSFTVVTCAPLNPFVWGILKTLQIFEPNERPEFVELAENLGIGKPIFFEEGWNEAIRAELVVSEDFQTASPSESGILALENGFIEIDREERGATLYFLLRDGEIVKWKSHFNVKNKRDLQRSPKWEKLLTPIYVSEAIREQPEGNELIKNNQKICDIELNWDDSYEVSLD